MENNTMAKTQRNILVVIGLMKGMTLKEVGEKFGISPTRCREITLSVIKKTMPEMWGAFIVPESRPQSINLNKLRQKCKYRLSEKLVSMLDFNLCEEFMEEA